MDESKQRTTPISLQQMDNGREYRKSSSVIHAPIPAPSADDMEPQNISFIGNSDEQISEGISRLNITSGSRTYRIPSPTRPLISRNAFQQAQQPPQIQHQQQQQQHQHQSDKEEAPLTEISSLDNDPTNQKGFYISFDNEQPKRPKPPLRMRRGSPKKEIANEPVNSYERMQEAKVNLKKLCHL